ncbi:exosortase C-terminal domain/associated protein EpsI [Candidatus Omnitrophota bacterium]
MKNIISTCIICALFFFVGVLSWRQYFKVYRQEDTVDISQFPTEIEGWRSEDIPLTELELSILETNNVFVRRYFNDTGKEIYLYIVYSQNNRKVSHPPEICYTGSGATIVNSVSDTIEHRGNGQIRANRLMVEKGNIEQVLFYWFKVGDSFTSNYWKQQGLIVLKSLFGRPASSALIRISANVENGQQLKAIKQIKEFGQLIVPHLYQYLP